MKNKLVKFVPVLLCGVSLTACTVLSDLGIVKGNVKSFASYKHEVSLSEFRNKVISSLKDTDQAKEGYRMKDSKLNFEIGGEAKQKLTNDSYANKTRNEFELSLNESLDASYDADNDIIASKGSSSMKASLVNAIGSEVNASLKGKGDMVAQPYGKEHYTIVNKNDKTYFDVPLPKGFNFNQIVSSGMTTGINYIADIIPADTEIEQALAKTGIKFKYYIDDNVFTVTGAYNSSSSLESTTINWNGDTSSYVTQTDRYGEALFDIDFKLQLKVVKVVKVRASVEGKITANFFKDHNPLAGGLISLSGLATQTCMAGDTEEITFKASAGLNYEEESVTNKEVNLSSYKFVDPLAGSSGYLNLAGGLVELFDDLF